MTPEPRGTPDSYNRTIARINARTYFNAGLLSCPDDDEPIRTARALHAEMLQDAAQARAAGRYNMARAFINHARQQRRWFGKGGW